MPNQATLPGGGQPGHTSRIHVDQQRVSLATSGFRQLAKCQTGQSGDTAQAVQSVDRGSHRAEATTAMICSSGRSHADVTLSTASKWRS